MLHWVLFDCCYSVDHEADVQIETEDDSPHQYWPCYERSFVDSSYRFQLCFLCHPIRSVWRSRSTTGAVGKLTEVAVWDVDSPKWMA